jgi:hypothetical protein
MFSSMSPDKALTGRYAGYDLAEVQIDKKVGHGKRPPPECGRRCFERGMLGVGAGRPTAANARDSRPLGGQTPGRSLTKQSGTIFAFYKFGTVIHNSLPFDDFKDRSYELLG